MSRSKNESVKDQKLPATAKAYGELAFREKENWRRRRAKISLLRKLEVLDRLRERARELAKIRLT